MSSIESDPLLIELMRQEEFLRGQLLIVQRVKKYVMENATISHPFDGSTVYHDKQGKSAAASLPQDPLGELENLLACTETLE